MPSRWHETTAWLILTASLAGTAIATRAVAADQATRDRAQFDEHMAAMVRGLESRMDVYEDLLHHAKAHWVVTQESQPDPIAWRRYVDTLAPRTRYPGTQGVGIAVRVGGPGTPTAAELAARLRERGLTGWRIWPSDGGNVTRYPIAALEPLDRRNRAALGYDMFSEPTRREAMVRARDLGQPALSGRVTLVQEIDPAKQAGFLLYVPLYRGEADPPAIAERRAAIAGFVYAPFRAGDLFQGVFGSTRHAGLGYRIYDGTRPDPGALLYAHDVGGGPDAAQVAGRVRLDVAGRPWLLQAWAPPGFSLAGSLLLPWLVGLGGTAIGLALFGLVLSLATSRARALALAEHMTAELRAANRAKDDWLSVISHELRTPLNFITGFASLLEDEVGGRLSPTQRSYVERINLGADRMLGLVNDLLDAAKMTAGRFEIAPEPTAYAALVEEAIASLRPLAQARSLHLEVAVAPEARDIVVQGDPARLIQVLTNLISNAVKFTEPGGRIDVRVCQVDGALRTEVADNGIGIEPGDHTRLFEPFRQADMSATRSAGGTGLGLSITKALIEAHGGAIGLESAPGRGSTFWFTLPQV